MFLRLSGTILLLCLALAPATSFAAKLLSIDLEQDGSNEPAGDVIHLRVLFEAQDSDLSLQVRALVVQGEFQDVQKPVAGPARKESDADVPFVVEARLAKVKLEGDVGIAEAHLVVPYTSLQLEAGKPQKLGYVVYAVDAQTQQTAFIAPTALSTITYSPSLTRRERKVWVPGGPELKRGEVNAYVLEAGRPVARGKVPGFQPTGKVLVEHVESVALPKPIAGGYVRETQTAEASLVAVPAPGERPAFALLERASSDKPRNVIYYATNRKGQVVGGEMVFAAENAHAVSYGKCFVEIPTRKEEQSWWATKYARLLMVLSLGKEAFYQELAEGTEDDVLLFTHGYNTGFEKAVLQAGRLRRDLDFKGKVMAYSWPSAGRPDYYDFDQTQAEQAIPHFAAFLEEMLVRAHARHSKIYVLVHSMGNRVFLHALRRVEQKMGQHFPHGVLQFTAMAAPDVDLSIFGSLIPTVVKASEMTSFYYSTFDRALQVSSLLHEEARAGLTPFFNDGLDTINVDNVNSSWVGFAHSYYVESGPVLYDLYLSTRYHLQPELRSPPILLDLATQARLRFEHWLFKE